jgi:hypothetical protein
MRRSLLALCLSLFASAALAGTPVAGDDNTDPGAKSGKASAAGSAQDGDTTAGSHPIVPPAHSSTHSVSPRWHSLLPGMIR